MAPGIQVVLLALGAGVAIGIYQASGRDVASIAWMLLAAGMAGLLALAFFGVRGRSRAARLAAAHRRRRARYYQRSHNLLEENLGVPRRAAPATSEGQREPVLSREGRR